jgi:hypothetical protein
MWNKKKIDKKSKRIVLKEKTRTKTTFRIRNKGDQTIEG